LTTAKQFLTLPASDYSLTAAPALQKAKAPHSEINININFQSAQTFTLEGLRRFNILIKFLTLCVKRKNALAAKKARASAAFLKRDRIWHDKFRSSRQVSFIPLHICTFAQYVTYVCTFSYLHAHIRVLRAKKNSQRTF